VPSKAYEVVSRKRPDGSLEIEVSLRPDVPDGRYSGALYLGSATEAVLISVALQAEVGAGVSAVPSTVVVRREAASGRYMPARVHVVARKPGLLIGPPRVVSCPAGITVRDRGSGSAPVRSLLLTFSRDLELPEGGVELDLEVVELAEGLRVRLVPAPARAASVEAEWNREG
jgi:hypothetical protein